MRPTGQLTSPYGIQVIKGYLLGFGECPEELMAWAMRTDWISDSIVAEWNRRNASEAERADKTRRGVNKEYAVSSPDKELAVQQEEGTGALHLRLALEGDKNKESKSKELGRLSSFKRGKDVFFEHFHFGGLPGEYGYLVNQKIVSCGQGREF
jgi:hypothetical protein